MDGEMTEHHSRIAWSRRQAFWNVLGLRLNRLTEWCYRKAGQR